jgi:hypothetical protein
MYGLEQRGRIDPGDPDGRERRLLCEARAAFEENGMPKHVEMTDALSEAAL